MSKPIDDFVAQLAQRPDTPHVFNPYAGSGETAGACRHNVRLYLHAVITQPPSHMLIGEALGYRGGCLSGIPFTSERQLALGDGPTRLLSHTQQFQLVCTAAPTAEASATIMWQTLARWEPLPLLWNAFPFHPHRPQEPHSNRPPSAAERGEGEQLLTQLLTLFEPPQLVAVGRQAERCLRSLELPHVTVRHPARGGKPAFVRGVQALWGRE